MAFSALIPFALLLICFVGLKLPLTASSFVALFVGSFISQFTFQVSPEIWAHLLTRSLEVSIEIGLILLGAFFFLEVAKRTGTLASLAKLVQEISPNRVVQGVLVTFPLELLFEGSSGFGTPLLIVAPLLLSLDFDLKLCGLLPFLSVIIAVPFGALGTPIRIGFPLGTSIHVSSEIFMILCPFTFIAPMLSAFLIAKKISIKETLWISLLALTYTTSGFYVTQSGPEFAALAPAFLTFMFGAFFARLIFRNQISTPLRERKGIIVYGLLLLVMWVGKQHFMDQVVQGTHIRIFNPGLVFIAFASALLLLFARRETLPVFRSTLTRARGPLFVFLCITLLVQELKESGALTALGQTLPGFLLSTGTPLLGWMGSSFIGTSTITNMMFAKLIDPVRFSALAAGSAIGVQMAVQSSAAMRSVLHERLSEKEIFLNIAPFSAVFILLANAFYFILA